MKLLRVLGWIVLVLVLLAFALIADIYFAGRPHQGRAQYVAMGSSFASGPAISERAADSPWFCGRSRDNYAHQLARLRGLELVDVTCGGATAQHILGGGQLLQPAQIAAVRPDTELVTVTIGGNDIGYMANLLAMGCDANTPRVQRAIGGCRVRSTAEMEQALMKVQSQLAMIVDEVHRRAPHARVVLVNYPTVLPATGSCDRLGLTAEQADQMRGIAAKLADTTRAAAQAHGALLLDAATLTRAHDVCAADPWMNGMHPERGLLGAPLHPTLAGMTAVADALNALLDGR